MIANLTEYKKAGEELRDLERRLDQLQQGPSIGSKVSPKRESAK
jgi:hypothetical protein